MKPDTRTRTPTSRPLEALQRLETELKRTKETADAEIKKAKEIVDTANPAMKEALLLQVETQA
jgi:hypothetical protein